MTTKSALGSKFSIRKSKFRNDQPCCSRRWSSRSKRLRVLETLISKTNLHRVVASGTQAAVVAAFQEGLELISFHHLKFMIDLERFSLPKEEVGLPAQIGPLGVLKNVHFGISQIGSIGKVEKVSQGEFLDKEVLEVCAWIRLSRKFIHLRPSTSACPRWTRTRRDFSQGHSHVW